MMACTVCGAPLAGQATRYCGHACESRAYRQRQRTGQAAGLARWACVYQDCGAEWEEASDGPPPVGVGKSVCRACCGRVLDGARYWDGPVAHHGGLRGLSRQEQVFGMVLGAIGGAEGL